MTKKVTMAAATAGRAEGGTTLNAFDNALLAAGIGNINLIKVSSILPPEVPVIDLPKIKPGALIPTAYAAMTSETPGETVAAAVGYAVPDDPAKNGVIMEFHGVASKAEAERQIHARLEEAFRGRGETIRDRGVVAVEHTVVKAGARWRPSRCWPTRISSGVQPRLTAWMRPASPCFIASDRPFSEAGSLFMASLRRPGQPAQGSRRRPA